MQPKESVEHRNLVQPFRKLQLFVLFRWNKVADQMRKFDWF